MKIAVNTRFLIKNHLEGIGWFSYEAVRRITMQHPEHQFHFLFDRKFSDEFIFSSNIIPHVIYPQARHPFLWYWWFEVSVPKALRKIQPDIFLSPDGYCSLRTAVKQVMVIHDLAFEHYSNYADALTLNYYKRFTPQYARKATRIATVSEFTKQDVIKQYSIPETKIDVAHNGGSELFRPLDDAEKKMVRERFTHGSEYLVYAGAIQPRKNIINLLLAFDLFKKNTASPVKLVLAGRNWGYREAMNVYAALQHKDDVIFHGHLPQKDLTHLIGAASAMVYVSLFEGFGIPIVEAMRCEVPVITSNVSSMPEVAGDAALLVNPLSVESIASQMQRLMSDETLRAQLIARGRVQQENFTWQNTADSLWQTIIRAAGQ